MIIATKQSKWKVLLISWFLLFWLGWIPIFAPLPYSKSVLLGLIVYGLWITFLILFFWKKYPIFILRFVQQIASFVPLLASIRWILLMSSTIKYVIISLVVIGYLFTLFLPHLSNIKMAKAINKWFNLHATKILIVVSLFGMAGASIGMFGGRIYGWKILIVPGIALGILSIFIASFMQKQELR